MSRICGGCGGVLGRDCYHESDCIAITQEIMRSDAELAHYTNTEALIAEVEGMRKSYSMQNVNQVYNEGWNAFADSLTVHLRKRTP